MYTLNTLGFIHQEGEIIWLNVGGGSVSYKTIVGTGSIGVECWEKGGSVQNP